VRDSSDAARNALAASFATLTAAYAALSTAARYVPALSLARRAVEAASYAAFDARDPGFAASIEAEAREKLAQCDLHRDLMGGLSRPDFDRKQLNPEAVSLARTIYDEHAFDRMAELADAIEGAGCADADILNHCRGPGRHVRGCWVLDLILGIG
jgi:hypothetical protein